MDIQPMQPNFWTSRKVNKKILLFGGIAILATAIAGGVYVWQSWEILRSVNDQLLESIKKAKTDHSSRVEGWETYRNEEYGFEVKYPKDWKYVDSQFQQNQRKNSVSFHKISDYPNASFDIIFSTSPLKISEYCEETSEVVIDYVKTKKCKIGLDPNRDYGRGPFGYEGDMGTVIYLSKDISHNYEIYIIDETNSRIYLEVLNQILSTFKFIDSGAGVATAINAERDFWATNYGSDGVSLYFADIPSNTARLKISRSGQANGPWTTVVDLHYANDLPRPVIDSVDGKNSSYYYKLEAFSNSSTVLKTFGIIFVPSLSWQTYRNEEYGFEVKYPKDWTKLDDSSGLLYVKSGNGAQGGIQTFFTIKIVKNYKTDPENSAAIMEKIIIGGRMGYKYFYQEGAGTSEVVSIPLGQDELEFNLDYFASDGSHFDERKIVIEGIMNLILSTFKFIN